MPEISFTDALGTYKAKARNVQWSFSAEAEDGSIVVSLWQHFFVPLPAEKGRGLRYVDHFSRMEGEDGDKPGLKKFKEHLQLALDEKRPLRLVIAIIEKPEDRAKAIEWKPAGKLKKTFDVRPELIGEVVDISDDRYVLDFIRPGTKP